MLEGVSMTAGGAVVAESVGGAAVVGAREMSPSPSDRVRPIARAPAATKAMETSMTVRVRFMGVCTSEGLEPRVISATLRLVLKDGS